MAAGPDLLAVRLEGGRVHRHQHVGLVARRVDVMVAELQLEVADAEDGALGGADLGRIVGQRREVVAVQRRVRGETLAGGFVFFGGNKCSILLGDRVLG